MKTIATVYLIAPLIMPIWFLGLSMVGTTNASFPITVTDDLGRSITITSPPERIVCIAPSTTEIVYALGLGDRVVGVDRHSDYPSEAVSKQYISDIYTPNPEEVAALSPDLVVMHSFYGPGDPNVEAIENLGINVIALKPRSLNEILNDIKLVGIATGKLEEAEALISQLNKTISQIREKTSNITDKPRVYMEFWYPPPWTFGPNTWADEIIRIAGGINVFGDAATDYVQTTDEEVIARDPDVIIITYGAQHLHLVTFEDVKKRPGWDSVKAVKNGRVYLIDENLIVRPGPRIVLGLETVASFLHPDLFGEVRALVLNTTILKTSFQSLNIAGVAKIEVLKALGNGTLTVTVLSQGPQAPSDLKPVGKYIKIDCSTPEGLIFTLKIYYSKTELNVSKVNENSLKIYYWNSSAEEWMPLPSFVNTNEGYVEALVTHLTHFALMGKPLLEPQPQSFLESSYPLWLVIVLVVAVALITSSVTYILTRKR